MPHLVVLYSPNLEPDVDMSRLCRALADAMLGVRDELDRPVFPPGGVRVMAFPATHCAVADGLRDYAFTYLNLRMGRGRTPAAKERAGHVLMEVARAAFGPVLARRYVGITLQIDEGQEVFDAKHSSIHPLFSGA